METINHFSPDKKEISAALASYFAIRNLIGIFKVNGDQ
jgi:hypothetical protein